MPPWNDARRLIHLQNAQWGCIGLIFLLLLIGLDANLYAAVSPTPFPDENIIQPVAQPPAIEWKPLLKVNYFGRGSYLMVLLPYCILLGWLIWRYRVILRFGSLWFFIRSAAVVLIVLGFALEWLADVFFVWTFPPGRDFCEMRVPFFGWITGHKVPLCELLWIVAVVPLFYYLWFWATLVFHDVIYVVDERGKFYKKEERWVGFHKPTRILTRLKNQRGQENEQPLLERPPGFVARCLKRFHRVQKT